jgi:hypothetical protein
MEGDIMYDTIFYVVTGIVIFGGGIYAIWYASQKEKRP